VICNVGFVTATALNLTETCPIAEKHGVLPAYENPVQAFVLSKTGAIVVGPQGINFLPNGQQYLLSTPFNTLGAGQNMTILAFYTVYNTDSWVGTIVFDSILYCNQIAPWKAPIGLYSVEVGAHQTSPVTWLWTGYELLSVKNTKYGLSFYPNVQEWPVYGKILRVQISHCAFTMTLDPDPVDLNGDGLINAVDVQMVRNVIAGSAPYDARMDCNANGKVDLADLALFKAVAGL